MTAREISPEVDRIVWSLGRATANRHRDRLNTAAIEAGAGSLHLLSPIADFLLGGGIARPTMKLRFLYFQESEVDARMDELLDLGLLAEDPRVRATERLKPALTTLLDAKAETASAAWGGDPDTVATALELARRAAGAAGEDHVVASLHQALPEPADPEAALEHNLVTLRYVRQHDHAEAWRERGLTPAEMSVLSLLWPSRGETAETSEPPVRLLVERGWVTDDGTELTPLGKSERAAIERATNERNDVVYGSLGQDARVFFDTLQQIPDADIVLS